MNLQSQFLFHFHLDKAHVPQVVKIMGTETAVMVATTTSRMDMEIPVGHGNKENKVDSEMTLNLHINVLV